MATHAHAPTAHGDAHDAGHAAAHEQGQQHPLGIYFKIWGLLFVLSASTAAGFLLGVPPEIARLVPDLADVL